MSPKRRRRRVTVAGRYTGDGGHIGHESGTEDALLPRLFERVVEAIGAGELSECAGDLVLAAYEGDAELAAQVEGDAAERVAPSAGALTRCVDSSR